MVDVEDLSLDVACLLKEPMDWNYAKAQEDGDKHNADIVTANTVGWSLELIIFHPTSVH